MIATTLWWDDGAQAAVEAGEPTHVFAAGDDAAHAVRLAVVHPDTVLSLVLADPAAPPADVSASLPSVTVPTLVVASAKDIESDLTVAQQFAGEIDNAVFVVVDGSARPVHTQSRASFTEWSSSFVAIAEGLAARDGRYLTPPTPLVEGALR
ncbi:hydrolase [Williamsia sp. 1138]|uniref:Hydrolase n=1 Tax=Gordonia rubripertincta TaxID=36822 RepID=A0ABT4N1D5_GORRU|nr:MULTISPECIES: hydrolase [Mycobacteriales]MCZ4553073.1 hydrolase [Gordonia rubripertincta]OZG27785.1 hydrolase [Williamsia sp. 1138]